MFVGGSTGSQPCLNTQMRQQAEQEILAMYGNVEDNLDSIFSAHISELRAYVEGHGEIPLSDTIGLASQAVLLRANDIALQGKALDICDEDSLEVIEQTEMAAQDVNSPDMYSALSMPVQASIKIILDKLSTQCVVNGGTGTMADLIAYLQGKPYADKSNGFDDDNFTARGLLSNQDDGGDDDGTDYTLPDLGDTTPDPSESVISTGLATIGSGSPISISAPAPKTDTSGLVGSTPAGSSGTPSSTLSFLSGLVGDATAVAAAVKSVTTSANSSTSAVKGLLSGVGASSIKTYIAQNGSSLLAIGAIIVIIIFFMVYAAKHNR